MQALKAILTDPELAKKAINLTMTTLSRGNACFCTIIDGKEGYRKRVYEGTTRGTIRGYSKSKATVIRGTRRVTMRPDITDTNKGH